MAKKNISRFIRIIQFSLVFILYSDAYAGQTNATKVVIYSPAFSEMLLFLDEEKALEVVAGVDNYTRNPGNKIPVYGDMLNPAYEKLLQLRDHNSNVKIYTQGRNDKLSAFCEQNHIQYNFLKIEKFADLEQKMSDASDLLDSEKAEKKLKIWKQQLHEIARIRNTKHKKLRTFLLIYPSNPNYQSFVSAGKNVFLSELLYFSGLINIFEKKEGWPKIALEMVLAEKPELILELSEEPFPEKELARRKMFWHHQLGNVRYFSFHKKGIYLPGPAVLENIKYLRNQFEN